MQLFVELAHIEGYDKNILSKVKALFTCLFTSLLVYLFASWHIAEFFFFPLSITTNQSSKGYIHMEVCKYFDKIMETSFAKN